MGLRPVNGKILAPLRLFVEAICRPAEPSILPARAQSLTPSPLVHAIENVQGDVFADPRSLIAAVTSTYSALPDFGNIMLTFVVMVCSPNRN